MISMDKVSVSWVERCAFDFVGCAKKRTLDQTAHCASQRVGTCIRQHRDRLSSMSAVAGGKGRGSKEVRHTIRY